MGIIANSRVNTLTQAWGGEVQSGSHLYLTDKPESLGGQDRGPAPYDFITAGLASCTMITLRMYAAHKDIELGEFSVEVDFYSNNAQQEYIERRVHFVHPLDAVLAEKILEICGKTPVTKTLLRSVEIHTTLV
ncbi:putative redox protein [Acinetobacter calcoaceticus]|uniref:Putative redox protein n=1 Tax=Acinetobacter calcoaceticus TaxID=471 RepID=A0A4R1XHR8_ACICA|nr:putative redox protein [Acinetobacter calcoaceticus]